MGVWTIAGVSAKPVQALRSIHAGITIGRAFVHVDTFRSPCETRLTITNHITGLTDGTSTDAIATTGITLTWVWGKITFVEVLWLLISSIVLLEMKVKKEI